MLFSSWGASGAFDDAFNDAFDDDDGDTVAVACVMERGQILQSESSDR